MAGHSHWARIKHKKQAQDAKKGKIFSKLARMIMSVVREGGPDVNKNTKLYDSIQKAKSAGMPKDTIENIIKRASGQVEGARFESVVYEGYGQAGVAVMVEALTDNRNRTSSEIRKLFEKFGATLAGSNSVAWQFEKKGFIVVDAANVDPDEILEDIINAGADNIEPTGSEFEITCSYDNFVRVRDALAQKYTIKSAEITLIPSSFVQVDEQTGRKLLAFIETIEDHEDVQAVHANFRLPDKLAQEIEKE